MKAVPILLTTCLLAFPAHAKYSGGSGTAQDPYQIATAAELILMGETPADYDKHFILTADIDLDPKLPGRKVFDRAVIAPNVDRIEFGFHGTAFTGVFDGNSHTISHLTIKGKEYIGLFGLLKCPWYVWPVGEVKNLGVVDVNVTGSDFVGGIAGAVTGGVGADRGTVTQCYSTGVVSGRLWVGGLVGDNSGNIMGCHSISLVSGDDSVGGLVGDNYRKIADCYSTGVVRGRRSVGGLVGVNSKGTLASCYSADAVSGTEDHVGGLVGSSNGDVVDCYSLGMVNGHFFVGGLVGSNSGDITNCYSVGTVKGSDSVGGLVGSGPACTGCFWDIRTSGRATSAGGTGLTTAQMQTAETYFEWGLCEHAGIWMIDDGNDYPRLQWEKKPGRLIQSQLSDFLKGHGTQDDPYLIYLLSPTLFDPALLRLSPDYTTPPTPPQRQR